MSTPAPAATVVVDARGFETLLERCIRSLAAQASQPSFDVIVLAGRRVPVIETHLPLGVLETHEPIPAGLEVAPICIFLGGDVRALPGLVAAHVDAHSGAARRIAVGRTTIEAERDAGWYARASAAANAAAPSLRLDPALVDGRNLSVRRDALKLLRSPGTPVAELAYELASHGYAVESVAGAHGIRPAGGSTRSLLARREREAKAHVDTATRRPETRPALLGRFTDSTPREVAVRQLLLAARMPPLALAPVGAVLRDDRSRQRWFALVSNLAYWRGVRRSLPRQEWRQLARGIPVLLYHAFGDADEDGRYVVAPRAFARQMRALSLLGWRVVPYDELARALRDGRLPPPRTAVLTIDDGYADNAEIAAPILERRACGATVYLVSGRLGGVNDWTDEPSLGGRRLLDAKQLPPLAAAGFAFGAHTVTHASLPDLDDRRVVEEVRSSRQQLEQALGEPVLTFAYPYGRLDDRAVAAARDAGFLSACTTEPRLARLDDDPFRVPRIEIKREDSLLRFLAKVLFGSV